MFALSIALVVFVAAMGAVLASWALTRRRTEAATAPERVPFQGGDAPEVHAWNRYHARYYLMALVFLAFDMEMVFMYPWAVVFLREGAVAMVEMAMFIGILLLGVLYGWREQAFSWA
jgi:NADH-quinone oxidoreductase subunit A